MSATKLLVRIPPYDPRRGHLKRGWGYKGHTFTHTWHRMPASLVNSLGLADIKQESGAPMFEIRTEEEAKAKEKQAEDLQLEKVINAKDVDENKFRAKEQELESVEKIVFDANPNALEEILAEKEEAEEELDDSAAEDEVEGVPVPAKRRGRRRKNQ